jgi:hypothetical protein
LYQEVIRAKERTRHKRDIIRRCSQQCGYLVEAQSYIITSGYLRKVS